MPKYLRRVGSFGSVSVHWHMHTSYIYLIVLRNNSYLTLAQATPSHRVCQTKRHFLKELVCCCRCYVFQLIFASPPCTLRFVLEVPSKFPFLSLFHPDKVLYSFKYSPVLETFLKILSNLLSIQCSSIVNLGSFHLKRQYVRVKSKTRWKDGLFMLLHPHNTIVTKCCSLSDLLLIHIMYHKRKRLGADMSRQWMMSVTLCFYTYDNNANKMRGEGIL